METVRRRGCAATEGWAWAWAGLGLGAALLPRGGGDTADRAPPERPAAGAPRPAMESRQEAPAPTDGAAEFLSLVGLKELEHCLFTETLAMVAAGASPSDEAKGQWWLAAQWAPYKRKGEMVRNCILVQARSRGWQDGVLSSSTLKAYVTPQLETLEQEEQECLETKPHPTEKSTHMVSHYDGMTVTKTLQKGEAEPQCQSFSYNQAEVRGLLLEGTNLLLLRVLARRQTVPPSLIFPVINTEGHLCTSSYSALGIQRQAVGSAETEVFVIERVMHTSTGISTVWHSSFLPNGRLAQMMQVGSPMLMLLKDESILSKSGAFEPQLPFPKEPLNWEEDIQLCSWFLDRKEELQLSHAAYLQQHPEVRELLSDFLQALLLRQPRDPISFAAEFFAHQRPIDTPFIPTGSARPLSSSPSDHPPANGE